MKKNKGIKAVCVRKHLKFDDYMQLFESSGEIEPEPACFTQFVRKAGEIRSEQRSKIMMAADDIKRIQLHDRDTGKWLAETRPIGWLGEESEEQESDLEWSLPEWSG